VDEAAGRRLPRGGAAVMIQLSPPGPPDAVGQGRLAARRLADQRTRTGAPRLSQGRSKIGTLPGSSKTTRCGGTDEGGGSRWDRVHVPRPSDGPVHVSPLTNTSTRPMAAAGKPARLLDGDPGRDAANGWDRRFIGRALTASTRGEPGGIDRGRRGDRQAVPRQWPGGFPEHQPGPHPHRPGDDRPDPGAGHALGPASGFRGPVKAEVGMPTFHAARIPDVATARHAVATGSSTWWG
jgi:hypothetical protein